MNYKILLTTALSVFLLLAAGLHAKSIAQRVSVSFNDVELEKALSEISRQTGYDFFYNESLLENLKTVNLKLSDASLEEAMSALLANTDLSYKIISGTVSIKRNDSPDSEFLEINTILQQNEVRGRITDRAGNPLEGASVAVRGVAGSVTISDANGQYRVTAGPDATLVITFMGYTSREILVNNRQTVDVTLAEDISEIGEVVVTGYQTMSQRFFTGATATLKGIDAERVGVPDATRMLEGQIAGVSIQNVSGTFGAAPKIRVRGATSISGENKPLWVIDGIIVEDVVNITNDQLSTGDPNTLIGSSIAGVNPDDIESFQILKDAAATAMYGARAMNGVIVVTTKSGRDTDGKPQLSYTSNLTGYMRPSYSDYNIMNSADQVALYLEMEEKGYLNHSQVLTASNFGVFGKMYDMMYEVNPVTGDFMLRNTAAGREDYLREAALRNTDWFDVLFKNSLLQEHSVSLMSGSPRSRIYASGSYLKDHGWTVADRVERFTGNIRGSFDLSEKVSVELLAKGSVRDQMSPGTESRLTNVVSGEYIRDFDNNPMSYALQTSRAMAALDANGNPIYYQKNYAPFNILEELGQNTLQTTAVDFSLQGEIGWNILKSLRYTGTGAYRYVKTKQEHRITEFANGAEAYRAGTEFGVNGQNAIIAESNRLLWTDPENPTFLPVTVLPYGGFYRTADVYLRNFYLRNQLNWTETFDTKHHVNLTALSELRQVDRQRSNFDGVGYQFDKGGVPYTDPNYFKYLSSDNIQYYGMGYDWDRYVAFMGRAAYSYDDKYNVNATMRYDGSNKLGKSMTARWLPTWNISAAWNLDQEVFFQDVMHWMSEATLRGTYGLVASMGPATNSSVVFTNTNTQRPFFIDRENLIQISSLENSELTWEKQYEANVGINLGFFNNRYKFVADFYDRKGFDLIGVFRTSGIDGQASKMANYADMKSKGMEFTLQFNNILNNNLSDRRAFSWNISTNMGYHVNEITELQTRPRIWDVAREEGGALVGYPVRGLFSIPFVGLDERGLPSFLNQTGDVSTDVNMQSTILDNLIYSGSIDPKLTGGFYNSVAWNGFSVGTLFTFQQGNVVRLAPAFRMRYSDIDAANNDLLARWLVSGDEGKTTAPVAIGRTGASGITGYPFNNYNYSDIRVAKGDFIRLKQVMLSYQLPSSYANSFLARSASISVVANNLWLLYSDKALDGQDPEFFQSGGVAMPIQRQFSVSFKFGF